MKNSEYKKYQIQETKKEINRLIASGMEKISLKEFKNMVNSFGLKLDLDTKNYLHKYFNTSNSNYYLEATTSALDNKNISWYNIEGEWYQKNVVFKTKLRDEFNKFRNTFFTVLPSGHILSL